MLSVSLGSLSDHIKRIPLYLDGDIHSQRLLHVVQHGPQLLEVRSIDSFPLNDASRTFFDVTRTFNDVSRTFDDCRKTFFDVSQSFDDAVGLSADALGAASVVVVSGESEEAHPASILENFAQN
jgi:hypothetical protein